MTDGRNINSQILDFILFVPCDKRLNGPKSSKILPIKLKLRRPKLKLRRPIFDV
jgi:hypothetical protein